MKNISKAFLYAIATFGIGFFFGAGGILGVFCGIGIDKASTWLWCVIFKALGMM